MAIILLLSCYFNQIFYLPLIKSALYYLFKQCYWEKMCAKLSILIWIVYAAIEMRDNPSLRNIPLGLLGELMVRSN